MTDDVRREPWWASGSGPAEGLDGDEDPLDRHTSARRGAQNGHAEGWLHDALGAFGDVGRGGDPRAAPAAGDVCHVCPVCVALRALDQSRPELVGHLSEALRHLSLAARAFVEAQVAATGGEDGGLQKVHLDDE